MRTRLRTRVRVRLRLRLRRRVGRRARRRRRVGRRECMPLLQVELGLEQRRHAELRHHARPALRAVPTPHERHHAGRLRGGMPRSRAAEAGPHGRSAASLVIARVPPPCTTQPNPRAWRSQGPAEPAPCRAGAGRVGGGTARVALPKGPVEHAARPPCATTSRAGDAAPRRAARLRRRLRRPRCAARPPHCARATSRARARPRARAAGRPPRSGAARRSPRRPTPRRRRAPRSGCRAA